MGKYAAQPQKSHTLKYVVGTPLQWLAKVVIPLELFQLLSCYDHVTTYLIITGESASLVQCINDILVL